MKDLIVTPAMTRILFNLVKKKISQPENENNRVQNQLIRRYEEQKKTDFSGSDVVVFLEILGFGNLGANLSSTKDGNEIVFTELPDETVKKFDQTITKRFNYNLRVSALKALYFELAEEYGFGEEQLPEPEEQLKRICELLGMQHERMMTMNTTKVSLGKKREKKSATIEKIFIKLSDEKDITRLNELISSHARTGILPTDLVTTVSTRKNLYNNLIAAMENLCGENAELTRIKDELSAKVNSSFKPDITQLVNQFKQAGQELVNKSTHFQDALNKLNQYQPSGEYKLPGKRTITLEEIDELIGGLPLENKTSLETLPPKARFDALLKLLGINYIETKFNATKNEYSIVTEELEKFEKIINLFDLLQAMNVAIDTVKNYATKRDGKVDRLRQIKKEFLAFLKNPQDQNHQNELVLKFFNEVSTAKDEREKMETKLAFMSALNQASKSYVLKVLDGNQDNGLQANKREQVGAKSSSKKKVTFGDAAVTFGDAAVTFGDAAVTFGDAAVTFGDAAVCNRQNILKAMEKAIGVPLQAFFKGEKYRLLIKLKEEMSSLKNDRFTASVLLDFINVAAQPREKFFATAQYGYTHSCKTFFDNLDKNNKQYVFEVLGEGEEQDKSFEKFVSIIEQKFNSQPNLRLR